MRDGRIQLFIDQFVAGPETTRGWHWLGGRMRRTTNPCRRGAIWRRFGWDERCRYQQSMILFDNKTFLSWSNCATASSIHAPQTYLGWRILRAKWEPRGKLSRRRVYGGIGGGQQYEVLRWGRLATAWESKTTETAPYWPSLIFKFLIQIFCWVFHPRTLWCDDNDSVQSLRSKVDPYLIYHSFSIINTLSLWHIPELSWETYSLYYLHPFV